MKKNTGEKTTKEMVARFEATLPLLGAMYSELQELSKKKPDATISKSKIQVINRLLRDIQEILKNEDQAKYLDLLVEDDLPQYSDVVLMLSQFVAAMTAYRAKYYVWDGIDHNWAI